MGPVRRGLPPNRETGRLIADAFAVPEPDLGELPGSGIDYLVKPLISGEAKRPA